MARRNFEYANQKPTSKEGQGHSFKKILAYLLTGASRNTQSEDVKINVGKNYVKSDSPQ